MSLYLIFFWISWNNLFLGGHELFYIVYIRWSVAWPCSFPKQLCSLNIFLRILHFVSLEESTKLGLKNICWGFSFLQWQNYLCSNTCGYIFFSMFISPHKSFESWREGSPRHTANASMSCHKWAYLGFNLSQLSNLVTKSKTPSCTSHYTLADLEGSYNRILLFSLALRKAEHFYVNSWWPMVKRLCLFHEPF